MKTNMNNVFKWTTRNAGRKLLIVVFSIGLAFSASAQRGHGIGGFHGGGGYYAYPRTYVGVGFGLGYGFGYGLGYPFFPGYGLYGPYAYPPYYYGYGAMPARLGMQIQTIKDDYAQQIKAVKQDKTLTHKEKRTRIKELKNEREGTIVQARKDYFFNSQRGRSNQPPTYNGNQQQQPNNQPGNQPNNNNAKPQSNGSSSQQNSNEQPEYSEKGGS